MHLIFTALGTYGHLYPLLPLAVAAREAGHEVTVATDERFASALGATGLRVRAAGIGLHDAFREVLGDEPRVRGEIPQDELAEVIGQVFGRLLPRGFVADLVPLLRAQRPDLLICEAGNLGGSIAAELTGTPLVRHGFGPAAASPLTDTIRAHAAATAAELGVSPQPKVPYIDPCPASAQSDQLLTPDRVAIRPVGWNEPGELPSGVLGHARPLVYLTLGTAMGSVPVLRIAITGLAKLDVDIVVATGPTVDVDALGAVPANVRVLPWVPQAALLPHVDLVVHHGGSGTTLGAFGAGLPQLLLPQGADQFSNAEIIVRLGLGDRLIGDQVTGQRVTDLAGALLTDTAIAEAARDMAREVAQMPTPTEVVERLPELARR